MASAVKEYLCIRDHWFTLVIASNGRTGIVSSAAGDYSFGQISGVATAPQLPAPTAYTDVANAFTVSQTFTGITVNSGVANGGTGIKHARVAACNAPGNGTCTTTLTWPGTAFANASYTATCTIDAPTPGAAQPVVANTSTKTVTTLAVRLRNLSGTASTGGTINCIAVHD